MTAGGGGGAETRDLRVAGDETQATDRQRPRAGELFAGRYRIESLLGEGGFGAVYAARDTSLDRDVALKILTAVSDDGTLLARFLQEAKAAASLESEHVAIVYEVGVANGQPHLVMERLRGRDLHEELATRTQIPSTEAIDLVLQAALGVAHAHARGIVHRDLKPRNLFLARRADGTELVKVLDFGIAKSASVELTESGATLGTTRYMAPEQLKSSRTVDARADIWALGVVLYELTTGEPIFDALSSAEFGVLILTEPHIPLRTRNPALSVELERVVDRCLAKDADDRYPDVGALARALAELGGALSFVSRIESALGARPIEPPRGATTGTSATTAARGEIATRPRDRSPSPLVVISLLVGAAGLVFGAVMGMRSASTSEAPLTGDGSQTVASHPGSAASGGSAAPDASIDAPAVVIDAPTIEATAIDAAPIPADAPPRTTTVKKPPVAPSDDEIGAISAHCYRKTSFAAVPTFLVTGASGHQFICVAIARLGCTKIAAACKRDAIGDSEKRQCRDFLAALSQRSICP